MAPDDPRLRLPDPEDIIQEETRDILASMNEGDILSFEEGTLVYYHNGEWEIVLPDDVDGDVDAED
jgi:hypothetical protein